MEQEVLNQVAEPSTLQTIALFMKEGGTFMWIILGLWSVGIAISLERAKALFSFDTNGAGLMNHIKSKVLQNDVHAAIQTCSNSKSLLAHVMKSGLKRANQTKEQISDAVEGAMLEVIPKAEKRLAHLGLVANISTLIGLLGTIAGLIQSFAAVANADPASKAKLLALGISKAMNTTAFGLISAISIMIVHAVLMAKSEKIIAEIEEYSSKIIDLLGAKKSGTPVQPNDEPSKPSSKKDKEVESKKEESMTPPDLPIPGSDGDLEVA